MTTRNDKPDLRAHTCDTCTHFLHSMYPEGQPGPIPTIPAISALPVVRSPAPAYAWHTLTMPTPDPWWNK